MVMEAYVNGVSTRKVDHLVSELGIQMSKGPGIEDLPRARRSGRGLPHLPAEEPTPTCGSTPSTSRSETPGMSIPMR